MLTPIQFILLVTLWNSLWFVAWSRSSLINLVVKFLFLLLAIGGWYLVFKS